jgi:hypothetical protein
MRMPKRRPIFPVIVTLALLAGCSGAPGADEGRAASDRRPGLTSGQFLVGREMAVRARQTRAENLSDPRIYDR